MAPRIPLPFVLRHLRVQSGLRGIFASPVVPLANRPTLGDLGKSEEHHGVMLDGVTADPHLQHDTTPLMENDDPDKRRIFIWRPTWWQTRMAPFKRLATWARTYFGKRPLTELELAEKQLDDERTRRNRLLEAQAVDAKKLVLNCLTRLNMCWRPEKGPTHEVAFDLVTFSELAIYLHVDTGKLPRGVHILELATESVCTDLSASVRHPVRANIDRVEESVVGLTYVVELAATFGIPDHVSFAALLKLIPKGYPDLSFPVGLTENKRPESRSLESWPHGIICGQTLGGKSNMQNVIVCSVVSRTTPQDVILFLVDLKGGGIEFGNYVGLPHLGTMVPEVPTGIARDVSQGIAILSWVCKESARRQNMFTALQADGTMIKSLDQWNHAHKTGRMPKILVVVDELALLLDPDDKASRTTALRLIREISATARAAGVYMLVATQSSDKYIFNNSVKTNFPGRIAFSFPDYSGSILAVNDGSAINLSPAGRAIYKNGTDKFLVQTPFITNGDIMNIVANAKAGKKEVIADSGLSAQEVIEWAIAENNMLLSKRMIMSKFAGRIQLLGAQKLLAQLYELTFTVGEYDYRVERGRGQAPSRVVRVDEFSPNDGPSSGIVDSIPQFHKETL